MVGKAPAGEHWIRRPERLRAAYDVVIIGAGSHGLAAAYYLAREHGIRNVAVLERGHLESSNSEHHSPSGGWSYATLQGMRFYEQNVRLWSALPRELDLNLRYATRGHFTLAHCDASLRALRWQCEVNQHHGLRCAIVARPFIAAQLPSLAVECAGQQPVVGALYHRFGAITQHDAVSRGYARAAQRLGVEIHPQTDVIGMDLQDRTIIGVRTTRGRISTRKVLCAVAGDTPRLLELLGMRIPLQVHPLQALISEPMQPWLEPTVVSDALQIRVSQTLRGELLMHADPEPYQLHRARPTLEFAESLALRLLELFPSLGTVKVLSHWAGLAEVTPDRLPILGSTPIAGFYLDAGWSTAGFDATPMSGLTLSHSVATGADHPLIESFNLRRFARFTPSGEYGAVTAGNDERCSG